MHILGIVIAVISAIGVWYWRYNMMRQAGSEVLDGVQRARGAINRRRFKNNVEGATLSSIDDPATAGFVLFMCLANEKPVYKERAKDLIESRMTGIVPDADMEETLIYSEWVAGNVVNSADPIRKFQSMWLSRLSQDELDDLKSIAAAVCDLGGGPNDEQRYALGELERRLSK